MSRRLPTHFDFAPILTKAASEPARMKANATSVSPEIFLQLDAPINASTQPRRATTPRASPVQSPPQQRARQSSSQRSQHAAEQDLGALGDRGRPSIAPIRNVEGRQTRDAWPLADALRETCDHANSTLVLRLWSRAPLLSIQRHLNAQQPSEPGCILDGQHHLGTLRAPTLAISELAPEASRETSYKANGAGDAAIRLGVDTHPGGGGAAGGEGFPAVRVGRREHRQPGSAAAHSYGALTLALSALIIGAFARPG